MKIFCGKNMKTEVFYLIILYLQVIIGGGKAENFGEKIVEKIDSIVEY